MDKPHTVLLLNDGHVDLANRRVVRGETTVHLTPTEQALLERLAAAEAGLVDGDTLLQEVWGYAPGVRSRAVYTAIQRLRAKLERDVKAPQHLLSVYGGGYRFVPAAPPEAPPAVSLPAETCPYFGRAELLAELRLELGAPGLVTLHGPGGMGKSRTALRCAHHMVEGGAVPPGGIFIVDVETVSDPDLLLDAVFSALEIPWPTTLDRAEAADHLVQRLRHRARWVLILDGVERAVDATRRLCRLLLDALAQLTVLVTSRLPLGLAGERVHTLSPLPGDSGVTLFIDRAARVRWGFNPSETDRAHITSLVTGPLAGMPLAIELAAARVGVLSVEALCTGLSARSLRDARRHGPRHQSLDAALSWSFEMLDESEAQALGWLSCFHGSPDLDDIRSVLAPAFDPTQIVDLLQQLTDAALLTTTPTGAELRYRLLTPIRERAVELLGSGSATATQAWFDHITRTAGELASTIHDPANPRSRQRLPWLRPDLLAAQQHAFDTRHHDAGHLSLTIDRLTEMVDPFSIRKTRIERALAIESLPVPRLRLLSRRVQLQHSTHAWDRAAEDLSEMDRLAESTDDHRVLALARGRHHMLTGALDEAIRHFEAAGDEPYALMRLGYCYQARGEHTRARTLYERSVRRFEDVGDGFGAAGAMGNLSLTVGELGDLEQSHAIAHRMLEIARKLNHGPVETSATQLLGTYALRACRFDEAGRWLDEAARLAHHFGYTDRAFLIDLNRAELRWEQRDPSAATRLLDDCLTRDITASAMVFAEVLRGALAHDAGDLDTAEQLLTRATNAATELGLADRQVFAGLSLGPLLAERDRIDEATATFEAVDALVHAMDDQEGITLVQLGRIHLLLSRYRANPESSLRQEIVRTRRRLPEPEGLLIRRAHRLLDQVGARSGIRLGAG